MQRVLSMDKNSSSAVPFMNTASQDLALPFNVYKCNVTGNWW